MRSNISFISFVSCSNTFSSCLYALKRKKNIVFVKILFICGTQEILNKFNNIYVFILYSTIFYTFQFRGWLHSFR
jgi:hypothetical protein